MTRLPSGGWTGKVLSRDGTAIAFERIGEGPPLVLVDGAMCYRASGLMRPLAALLAQHFTMFLYDRRGRGESGNVLPDAVEREIEDLDAMIKAAGGWAFLFGVSSGAALALAAARSVWRCAGWACMKRPSSSMTYGRPSATSSWRTSTRSSRRIDGRCGYCL